VVKPPFDRPAPSIVKFRSATSWWWDETTARRRCIRVFLRARLTSGPSGDCEARGRVCPPKAYRECLNRSFAFLLIRGRDGRSPDAIAKDALSACQKALAAFSQELMPVVKDRMKAWLVSGGRVPENLWW
jgi:hypothetical protein